MSKLMIILGIIVAAAGAVVGALIYVSPGQMQVLGLTPEVAAVMLVGGLGLIGLGGVIGAMDRTTAATRGLRDWLAAGQDGGEAAAMTSPAVVSDFSTATIKPSPFPVPPPVEPPPSPTSRLDALLKESKAETSRALAESKETVSALDKAKERLEDVLSPRRPETPPPPPVVEPEPEPEPEAVSEPAAETVAVAEVAEVAEATEVIETVEEGEDPQLFVVEERLIRGRPARVLSDGTVEAETDDGWMRFENLEHLEEYLDAMSPGQA
ncbi:MAG: hypothetical protein AB7F74_16795 [Parvibaculaceae bacterium]